MATTNKKPQPRSSSRRRLCMALISIVLLFAVGEVGARLVFAYRDKDPADYVLSRRPDVLLIPQAGTSVRLPAILEIWEHPDFNAHYAWDPHLEGYRREEAAPSTPSTSAREEAAGAARSTAPRPSTPTAATSATTWE